MAQTQEQKDIIEIKNKIERMENHFKVYKSDVADIKESVKEIRNLLGGSELNGHKGFVKLVESIEEKVDSSIQDLINMKKDIENSKFWGRAATVFLSSTIILILSTIFKR